METRVPATEAVMAVFHEKRIAVNNPPAQDFVTTKWLQSNKASCRCECCSHEWETAFDNVTRKNRSSGCPKCAHSSKADKLLQAGLTKVEKRLRALGYERIGPYNGHFEHLQMRCAHGHEFAFAPVNLASQRCPKCSGNSQHVSDDAAVAEYITGTTWTSITDGFKCSCCGAVKKITMATVKAMRLEPIDQRSCNCVRYGQRFTNAVAAEPGYSALEVYRGMKVAVAMHHESCGTTWACTPGNFLRGTRCPKCARAGRASSGQRQVAEYLRSLGVVVEENVTGLDSEIPRAEVDIYLPDYSVAVEFDGVWWHAEGPSRERAGSSRPSAFPDAIVSRLERLAAAGVRLIRIFSDEWANERDAMKHILRMAIGMEEHTFDPSGEIVQIDRRLFTAAHETGLAHHGYQVATTLPPSCRYVHPSASNTRIQFTTDEEAISLGYSRVWDSGTAIFAKGI